MTTMNNGIVHLTSSCSVADVLEHLLSILRAKGVTLFAVIDHSSEAAKAGLEMPDTKLVIFGDPKAGTPLMIAAPDIALDLPLKILIAANNDGTARITYNDLSWIKSRFGLTSELMANIAGIEKIAGMLNGSAETR
jgi:uncharacterized protein (DUF302 family)